MKPSTAMSLGLFAAISQEAVSPFAKQGGSRRPVSYINGIRKNISAIAIAAVCSALSLFFGCQATRSEAPIKIPSTETPQDEALSKSVRDRLLTVKTQDLSTVKVVSSSGTVYLTGTVTSLNARQQAIKIAWTVPGVQSVVNALEVQK